MRKFIGILSIILIAIGILLGGAWLVSRRTAQKTGTAPRTFREFVTGQSPSGSPSPSSTDGGLSSDFTSNTQSPEGSPTSATGTPSNTSSSPNSTRTSIFTNNNLTPTTTPNGGQITPSSQNPSTPTGGGVVYTDTPVILVPVPPSTGSNPGSSTGTGVVTPSCTDADLNITFTPAELARLQTLQTRFYAVAQTLHNDSDVSTELANHDTFKAKVNKVMELYTYCQNKTPQIAGAMYQTKVPTPYWRDPAADTINGFVSLAAPRGSLPTPSTTPGIFGVNNFTLREDTSVENGKSVLERLLRINLW